ncbi:MAG: TetR/AcrR family transcriptional regulator, partial [Thermodesulfobacteriota bacterium]|nr:TetR/AcrR family transcriptional regulator [Thermodesulfobacteriota bacterium]
MGKVKKNQGENTRGKILAAATKLICENGYSNTTLEEIAKQARTGKSTIFYHFKNKEEILSAVMEQSVLEINKTIREITNSNLTPEEKLKDALNNHL